MTGDFRPCTRPPGPPTVGALSPGGAFPPALAAARIFFCPRCGRARPVITVVAARRCRCRLAVLLQGDFDSGRPAPSICSPSRTD